MLTKLCFGFDRHTEGNACLRQKRDTEVLDDVLVTAHCLGAEISSAVFSCRTGEDINETDQNDHHVRKDRKLKLGAADNEEENEQRRGPTVETVHQLGGKIADVAEDRSEHHADEQRREADMNSADLEFEHREGDGQKDERHRHRKTLGSRMEEAFEEGEEEAHHKSERKRENDLKDRLNEHRDHVDSARNQCLGNAERNGEENETDGIVERDDGKKNVGQGALCLILTDDHQRSGRCGCRSDGTENDGGRERELVGSCQMNSDEHRVHQKRSNDSLHDSDDSSLLARLFELSETELVTDGKGDKAERHVGDNGIGFDVCHADKAKSGNTELTENVRSDEDTRNEVCRDGGELEDLRKSRKHQTRKHGDRECQKRLHLCNLQKINFRTPTDYSTFFSECQERFEFSFLF